MNTVPVPGYTVDLFGNDGPTTYYGASVPPPDPATNVLSGLTIDVSGTGDAIQVGIAVGIHDPN